MSPRMLMKLRGKRRPPLWERFLLWILRSLT